MTESEANAHRTGRAHSPFSTGNISAVSRKVSRESWMPWCNHWHLFSRLAATNGCERVPSHPEEVYNCCWLRQGSQHWVKLSVRPADLRTQRDKKNKKGPWSRCLWAVRCQHPMRCFVPKPFFSTFCFGEPLGELFLLAHVTASPLFGLSRWAGNAK